MGIAGRLASALGRNDEQPNIELAEEIAASGDAGAVAELVGILTEGKKPARHDAIKALYETGERNPKLVSLHLDALLDLLSSKDNRMVWGAMSALAAVAGTVPERLIARLNDILTAADEGSVIAKDKAMVILAGLNSQDAYHGIVEPVVLQRLRYAAVNQFPMYAELTAPTISEGAREDFITLLKERQAAISYPAKKARIGKLLKKLNAS